MAQWRKKNDIFGFFGVRYTNRGQTKYGINSVVVVVFFFLVFFFLGVLFVGARARDKYI